MPPAARAGFEKGNLLPAGANAHNKLVALNHATIAGAQAQGRKQGFPYYSKESTSGAVDHEAMGEDPCVAVELSRRRVAKEAYTTIGAQSVRTSMPVINFTAGRGGGLGPRFCLRSSKETHGWSMADEAGLDSGGEAGPARREPS